MADEPNAALGLVAKPVELEHSLEGLAVAFKPPLSPGADALLHAPVDLHELRAPDPHSVNAQLLTEHTPGWHVPHPSRLPAPTYAPATTAFGIVFVALGGVTMWPLSVIGAAIVIVGLATWIGDLL